MPDQNFPSNSGGVEPKDIAMPALTFVGSAITLGAGRTYVMQGPEHQVVARSPDRATLVLFAAFLFLAFVP